MLTNLRPRVVAHLDLVRMYRPLHLLSPQVWDKIRRNVNYIVSYGAYRLYTIHADVMARWLD